MTHLSDEQLGAIRDRALPPADTAAAERHLATCEACRERLAELVVLDDALANALEHDPGEAYFESFAGRVAARIAAERVPGAVAAAAAAAPRARAPWWNSPRRLAWAGGALALVVVSAVVATLTLEHGSADMAARVAPRSEVGAGTPVTTPSEPPPQPQPQSSAAREDALVRQAAPSVETAAPAPSARRAASKPAPLAPRALAPARPATQSEVIESEVRAGKAAPAPAGQAATQNVVEMRTLPNGEQVPVQSRAFAAPAPAAAASPAPAPPAAPGFAKSLATPMAQRLQGGAAPVPVTAERRVDAAAEGAADRAGLAARDEATSGAPTHRVCGVVRDPRGHPVAHALVMVAESGASTSAGADGAFCVEAPAAGGTLAVLAVGYRPWREHVGAADAQAAVVLAPVDVLGSAGGAVALGGAANPSLARRAALDAQTAAKAAGTSSAWTKAAERWDTVADIEGASAGTSFRAAECRVNAWLVGRADAAREPQLHAAAHAAVDRCLALNPAGAARDVTLGWSRALER